ncbi:putative carbamoylphosphate synthase large subunit short form [Flexistipes sinusarabici DSM 4947]|uniref:Carbamoylphosphate synthase large subunit short form n=1 Tax=Flexistipes sinusarabici (strain ATCC 49648 / DSM 4947 / MAS 10) TaxID=717231 RepID=F8E8L8_FLESM|nr:ATP-grasp domain-containing protein [Flexistipes sinusarabici]AEI14067.1 putative carbamoylphosphate synthase large subunit short form [Flexistipes sinusarabici DSM 4947]
MKQYNVLVFPCGTEIANEIINSLQNNKYFKLFYASSEKVTYCSFRGKEVNLLPYVTDESFIEELERLIFTKKIDFIVPAHDDVAFILSQIENEVEAKVIGQSKAVNDIVRFKDVTYKLFENILPVGKVFKTQPLASEFPVFIKPKKGQGSFSSYKLSNLRDFEKFFSDYDIDDFVVMEYLPGSEFTIDCFSSNGALLYFGARNREKTSRGISVQSTFISDDKLNKHFEKYAKIISSHLNMHGVWFYQMKFDKNYELKLLEIGPRVSGTMMLNRARGVNFIELAIYQKLGFDVEVIFNDIEISLARALVPIYKHNVSYENLYIDFDDTLCIDEKIINTDLIKLIFQNKNEGKNTILISKNKKGNLSKILNQYGISQIFDTIIHISDCDKKKDYMKDNSVLIDDSFAERKEAHQAGHYVFGIDNFNILFKD